MLRKLVILAAVLLAAWLLLRTPDIPADVLRDRYTTAASAFIEVEPGLTLHVRDEGPADAPALVLVHGSAASLHTWEPWVARLSGDYRIISYDQAGHGLTGPHPRGCYTAACFVAALEALRSAKQLESFFVAGNSMGGWVAWNYALAHPDRLAGMILIDAAGTPVRPAKVPIGFRIMATPVVRDIAATVTPRAFVARSLRDSVGDPARVTDAVIDRYWELLRYPGQRAATLVRSKAPRTTASRDALATITTPTLILWGAKDTLIPLAAARWFAAGLPNERTIVYEALGHIPHEEDPDRTAADVRLFIEGLRPPA